MSTAKSIINIDVSLTSIKIAESLIVKHIRGNLLEPKTIVNTFGSFLRSKRSLGTSHLSSTPSRMHGESFLAFLQIFS